MATGEQGLNFRLVAEEKINLSLDKDEARFLSDLLSHGVTGNPQFSRVKYAMSIKGGLSMAGVLVRREIPEDMQGNTHFMLEQ